MADVFEFPPNGAHDGIFFAALEKQGKEWAEIALRQKLLMDKGNTVAAGAWAAYDRCARYVAWLVKNRNAEAVPQPLISLEDK